MPDAPVIAGPDGEERPAVLGMSADAKGVSMRPDALRAETARKAAKRDRKGDKRLGSGEKQAKKRMAETGAVFDSLPPDGEPRTPQDIMVRPAGQPPRTPQALNKWYTCGITATCAEVIAQVMAEAGRRDPELQRDWLALVDGNAHQIECFQNEAADRGKAITILIDFIHVIEYLWKAALAFTPPGDTRATEDQVTAWGLDILAGNSRGVIAGITARAAADPPRPGGEHEKNIRKTTHYLQAKEPFLGYPAALAKGWPIATGIIEGACRHIIGDRLVFSSPRHVDLCPPIRQTVRAGCSSASYRLPRVRVSRGCERPGVPGGAARRPGVLDRGRRGVRQGRSRRSVPLRSPLRPGSGGVDHESLCR